MKLSLQSLAFPHPRDALRPETYAMLAGHGYAALEIVPETFTKQDARLARRLAADHGMDLLLGWSLFAEHDPSSADLAVRAAGRDQLRHLVELAAIMGARRIGGVLYAGCGRLSGRPPERGEWERSAEILREAAVDAAAADAILCLEPATRHDSHLINCAEHLMAFLDLVDHPNVAGLLDTWQMLREETDIAAAIRLGAPRCGLIHLSESHRGALGTGTMPWPAVFAALDRSAYGGWIGVEAFFDPDGFVAPHARIWRRLGGSVDEVIAGAAAFVRRHMGTAGQ